MDKGGGGRADRPVPPALPHPRDLPIAATRLCATVWRQMGIRARWRPVRPPPARLAHRRTPPRPPSPCSPSLMFSSTSGDSTPSFLPPHALGVRAHSASREASDREGGGESSGGGGGGSGAAAATAVAPAAGSSGPDAAPPPPAGAQSSKIQQLPGRRQFAARIIAHHLACRFWCAHAHGVHRQAPIPALYQRAGAGPRSHVSLRQAPIDLWSAPTAVPKMCRGLQQHDPPSFPPRTAVPTHPDRHPAAVWQSRATLRQVAPCEPASRTGRSGVGQRSGAKSSKVKVPHSAGSQSRRYLCAGRLPDGLQ